MKPITDKKSRQANAIEVGRRIAVFLDDPAISDVLAEMEAFAIETMIEATSDRDREREAVRIQVIRNFKTTLAHKAKEGERANLEVKNAG